MTRHWDFYCCGCWVSFLFLKLCGLLAPVKVKRRKLGWRDIYPPVLWSSLSQTAELPFGSEDCGSPEVVISLRWAILNLPHLLFRSRQGCSDITLPVRQSSIWRVNLELSTCLSHAPLLTAAQETMQRITLSPLSRAPSVKTLLNSQAENRTLVSFGKARPYSAPCLL